MMLRIQITGMHCSHCIRAVEDSLKDLPGVRRCGVRLGEADVSFDEALTDKNSILIAIREAGLYDIAGFTRCE